MRRPDRRWTDGSQRHRTIRCRAEAGDLGCRRPPRTNRQYPHRRSIDGWMGSRRGRRHLIRPHPRMQLRSREISGGSRGRGRTHRVRGAPVAGLLARPGSRAPRPRPPPLVRLRSDRPRSRRPTLDGVRRRIGFRRLVRQWFRMAPRIATRPAQRSRRRSVPGDDQVTDLLHRPRPHHDPGPWQGDGSPHRQWFHDGSVQPPPLRGVPAVGLGWMERPGHADELVSRPACLDRTDRRQR